MYIHKNVQTKQTITLVVAVDYNTQVMNYDYNNTANFIWQLKQNKKDKKCYRMDEYVIFRKWL